MIRTRKFTREDHQFLREILFEAVFWSRSQEDRPSLEEGLSYDYTKHVLKDFGTRVGDIAVIAEDEGQKVGAAFIRYWNHVENIRGYIADEIPVLVIGVVKEHRRQGIASSLITAIKSAALVEGIDEISLCVTKTNIALGLYEKSDFKLVEEIDGSYNMLWKSSEDKV